MTAYSFLLASSLEKVFPQRPPRPLQMPRGLSLLHGESACLQLAFTGGESGPLGFSVQSTLSVAVRSVELVPSSMPVPELRDENYLTSEPGLFPDLLLPLQTPTLSVVAGQWRALWLNITASAGTPPGVYPVTLSVKKGGEALWQTSVNITVIAAELPPQTILHTEWFHADCLAQYYNVEVFSEEHWRIIGNFIAAAASHGVNLLLTPIFTPPLDTKPGGERTTVQLVDVSLHAGRYAFGFGKLKRWLALCKSHGITHFELSHLFTQWGAAHAPKIMAETDNGYRRIFGWDTDALASEYQAFLHAFLPQLTGFLRAENILEQCFFHISDEPEGEAIESYKAAKQSIADCLTGCTTLDALSNYELYRLGLVNIPVVAEDFIQPFIDAAVPHLWAYYCCAQTVDVCNRFMSMPSARNRALSLLLYLYRIEGFLHWGYNFYNSQFSLSHIDPYQCTDADGHFPSGDPFLVYPAPNGSPYGSIRLEVLSQAMCDLRALQLLESLRGREAVLALIKQGAPESITFRSYPRDDAYYLALRENVNAAIAQV